MNVPKKLSLIALFAGALLGLGSGVHGMDQSEDIPKRQVGVSFRHASSYQTAIYYPNTPLSQEDFWDGLMAAAKKHFSKQYKSSDEFIVSWGGMTVPKKDLFRTLDSKPKYGSFVFTPLEEIRPFAVLAPFKTVLHGYDEMSLEELKERLAEELERSNMLYANTQLVAKGPDRLKRILAPQSELHDEIIASDDKLMILRKVIAEKEKKF